MSYRKRDAGQELLSPPGRYPSTPKINLGQIRTSPVSQANSTTPIFLDVINDFSDLVDFHTKCDQFAHGEEPTGRNGSQKKCRFCS